MQFRTSFGRGQAILWDGELLPSLDGGFFDPKDWPEQVGEGRGAARGRSVAGRALVWRHYRRGGLPARLSEESYLFTGLERTRPWREMHLTARLYALGLPVPRPVAARVVRRGLFYHGDLVTERIPARSFAERLTAGAVGDAPWEAVGVCIARFHAAGLDHADLNARNLLVDEGGTIFLIDLDRGRLRAPGRWREGNLARLARSLRKLGLFDEAGWRALEAGYMGVN